MSAFHASAAVSRVAAASKRPVMGPPGEGVVSLAMGEPDFATPAHITAAAVTALHDGETRYVDQ
ncbi:MAG: aspartate aminotransferase, partial [Stackebrandtia sp.]